MKYGIKYFQDTYWAGGIKTDKGYEAWINHSSGYGTTLDIEKTLKFENLNDAYNALQCLHVKRGITYYWFVEELPK